MDVAEEYIGLYADAIETSCAQSDSMSVIPHTSVLKVR
jgi:hypothetical protein